MLAIDDEQRAVGVLQYGTADWSEKFLEMLTVVGAHNHQLHRSAVVSQKLYEGAVYRHRLHPEMRIAVFPTGQPAIEVGECPAMPFALCRRVVRHDSPADDRLNGGVAQPGFFHGDAQQHTVVRRLVYFDDDPRAWLSGLIVGL